MKKRLLAILLSAAVACSLCACGDSNGNNAGNVDGTEHSQTKEVSLPAIETLADYSDLSVVLSGDYEITDEVLSAYCSEVLYNAGVGTMKVTDRDTVQAGDLVKADYTGYVDGVPFKGGSTIADGQSNAQWLDVSNNCGIDITTGNLGTGFIDGFTDGIIGAKIGEPKSSDVTFPSGYGTTTLIDEDEDAENDVTVDLSDKEVTFEFTVHEIYREVTPEDLTDAFVAEHLSKTYEVNTVAEFMEFLEKELAYNYVINYVANNSTYDMSEEYLYSRLEDYQNYFEKMYCQGMTLSDYLATYYGYTLDQAQVEWLQIVQNQVKNELVFAAMVEKDGLTVDEAGHDAFVKDIIEINGTYFPDADSIHKYSGLGNAEAGENYMKNQTAVRDNFLANYSVPKQ